MYSFHSVCFALEDYEMDRSDSWIDRSRAEALLCSNINCVIIFFFTVCIYFLSCCVTRVVYSF